MNILVTGSNGQLGSELEKRSAVLNNHQFYFTDVADLDITQKEDVDKFMADKKIGFIINCAAYTAVDKAEDEFDKAMLINSSAVKNLGEACSKADAKIIHISTDYVFNGNNHIPYKESDPVCPESAYGKTKLSGEEELQNSCKDNIIIRTSWLYSIYGNNFVKTMLRLGKERDELNVIYDQTGTPTNAGDLADAILTIVGKTLENENSFIPGIYNFSNEGVCSWYDFAVQIFRYAGIECKVNPIEAHEFPSKVKRPHYSVLNKKKIKNNYGLSIPYWLDSLEKSLKLLL